MLGQTTAAGDGTWTITSSALADGDHTLIARSTDPAGNASVSDALTMHIDATAPVPDAGADQNVLEGTEVTLTGSYNASPNPGDGAFTRVWHLVSSSNGQSVADVTGDVLTFTPVDNGTYIFSYTVTDAAGNTQPMR